MFSRSPRSPLSLSEDEKSPMKARQERDIPITKLDQGMKHASTFSGINLPRTDFLKALNFERFSARSCLDTSGKGEKKLATIQSAVYSDEDSDEASETGDDRGFLDCEVREKDGNVRDDDVNDEDFNDSDAENQPPFEKNGEMDQAELLDRFKQLRDLQLQEQQRLILDQQRQLEKLRDEQQKVQDMLIAEQIAALSPQKAPTGRAASGFKVKLMNSPRAKDSGHGSDTSEFDYNHNKKAAVGKLPDDRAGEDFGGRGSTSDKATAFEHVDDYDDDDDDDGEDDGENDDDEENDDEDSEDQEVEEGYDQAEFLDDNEERQNEENDDEEEDDEEEEAEECDSEDVDEDYLQCSIVETEAEEHVNHVEDLLRNSRDLYMVNRHNQARPSSDEEVTISNVKTPVVDIEEQPVSGARKTFEELLEEELRREKQKNDTPTSTSGGVKKRPFLRRGEGLARFGSSPAVRKPLKSNFSNNESQKMKPPMKNSAKSSEIILKLQKPTPKSTIQKSPVKQSILFKKSPAQSTPKSSVKRSVMDDTDLNELEEFELLEKYADDYSFTSNCSIINPRPSKSKKCSMKTTRLLEHEPNDYSRNEIDNENTTLKNSHEFDVNCAKNTKKDETPSEPSSTPRRLKRKIVSRTGVTTYVEKDVLVEDYSPVHDGEKTDDTADDHDSDFDDEVTWLDTIPKPNFSRPNEALTTKSDTPPTSKLVARLFPSLKTQPKKEEDKPKTSDVTNDQGVMSKALKDKLAELELEIEKFRSENAVLAKIKKERFDALEELKKEVEAFEAKKKKEMNEIEDMREEELRKIRNARKLFDKYQKEVRAIPDKNQRKEIDELKMELQEARDEMKMKETRWSASMNRMKNRIENLEKEKGELQDELKLMEEQRLEMWQKEIMAKNNEKKKKTQTVPPQQQKSVVGSDCAVSAQLREQFDKLLRASIDDSPPEKSKKSPSADREQLPDNLPRHSIKSQIDVDLRSDSTSYPENEMDRKQQQLKKTGLRIDFGNGKFREIVHPDGKLEREYFNGSKEVIFVNGTRKQISADSRSVIVSFFNGDIKQILPDQRIVYYYADSKTQHTTYPDGIEILEFPNHQIEKHYPNGTREIIFPDQTIKYLYPGGAEESVFADGTIVKVDKNGDRVMNFPNGQREIHTKEFKKREYPDGTTKTVYPDGRQETRYSSGRLRVKDADGNVLVDKVC